MQQKGNTKKYDRPSGGLPYLKAHQGRTATFKGEIVKKHWSENLRSVGACSDAIEWCETQASLSAAWNHCNRGDWMLWLIGRTEKSDPFSDDRKPLVRCAVECAELAPLATGDCLNAQIWCLDATRRWCDGETDREEVEAARYAAYAASAYAAYAAYASYAAYVAYAASADASADAAYVASAAYAAASAYAASAAAREKALGDAADIVRRHFPSPPKIGCVGVEP